MILVDAGEGVEKDGKEAAAGAGEGDEKDGKEAAAGASEGDEKDGKEAAARGWKKLLQNSPVRK